ncbi:MAG TPA: class I SAM-dependent methyltransferase [Ignavibacteriaceae bacterium]|nr:class I SAM-dependent methyltransferase [Ignavibacteriaceae bacterium]
MKNIFDDLKKHNIFHFGSYISGSQYLNAYKLIRKYAEPESLILDWGAGSGHFSFFLLNQGHKVDAFTIENECKLSDHLKKTYPDKYRILLHQDPLAALPFDDQSFDIVVSIGVLEHVSDTNHDEIQSLKQIRRVLKPNGVFICYHFPNKYSWIEAITKYLNSKYNHNYKYTTKDITELNEKSKMELLEYGRYGIMPRNSFRVIPNNLLITTIYNSFDYLLSKLLNPFCQNYYFVSRQTE